MGLNESVAMSRKKLLVGGGGFNTSEMETNECQTFDPIRRRSKDIA